MKQKQQGKSPSSIHVLLAITVFKSMCFGFSLLQQERLAYCDSFWFFEYFRILDGKYYFFLLIILVTRQRCRGSSQAHICTIISYNTKFSVESV